MAAIRPCSTTRSPVEEVRMTRRTLPVRTVAALLLGLLLAPPARAQAKPSADDASLLSGLRYRLVGPFRGGRSGAVTGVPGRPLLFYFGSTGGGVWRTGDGGATWENISDGFFGGSIGAVAVSESDPNVIYVGGGFAHFWVTAYLLPRAANRRRCQAA
jgi:hypothetical protein